MRRAGILFLSFLLAGLQYRLWIADGGLAQTHKLGQEVEARATEVEELRARNAALEAEVADLKSGSAAIEARARESLGMIRKGETFYLVFAG